MSSILKLAYGLSVCVFFLLCCKSTGQGTTAPVTVKNKPNVIIILADQWRAQATGYSGNSDVITPNIDKLSRAKLYAVLLRLYCAGIAQT